MSEARDDYIQWKINDRSDRNFIIENYILELEKQNEELFEFIFNAYTNNIDNRFNGYAKEILEKIKQKPIEEIVKEQQ